MSGHRWQFMLRPRWVAWHVVAVIAFFGMLWLGDWQLHRAESGNELSWAYTIEWPLFAICGVYFYIRTIREELHLADKASEGGRASGAGAAEGAGGAEAATAAEPESSEAYLARLRAEVAGHGGGGRGRLHGWR
jgi:hypothetical protein